MKTRLGVSFEIDFAHTLRGHPKCGKPHGHTSRIIVEVQGDVKKGASYEENMVIEFDKMKKLCWTTIEQLDHRNLNDLFDFPTSENIAEWIFENAGRGTWLLSKAKVNLASIPALAPE